MRYAILTATLGLTLASAATASAATSTIVKPTTTHAAPTQVDYDYYGRWYCGPHCQYHAERRYEQRTYYYPRYGYYNGGYYRGY